MNITSVNRQYVADLRIPRNVEVCWNPVRKRCEFHRTSERPARCVPIDKMRLVDAAAKGLWACGEEQVMWSCYHAGRLPDKPKEHDEPTSWFNHFDGNIEPLNDMKDGSWWEFTRWQYAGRETARTKLYAEGKIHGEGTATAEDMRWEELPATWAGDPDRKRRERMSLYGRATYAEFAHTWKEMNYTKDELVEFQPVYEERAEQYELCLATCQNGRNIGCIDYEAEADLKAMKELGWHEAGMHAQIVNDLIVSQEQSVEDWFCMIQPGDEPEGLGDEPWYEE